MAENDFWWEPPLAGTEEAHLLGALDRLRVTFRWKADDLDSAGLNARIGASALTLGGLLKHLARVEDVTFNWKLRGRAPGPDWDESLLDDTVKNGAVEWEFASAAEDSPEFLYDLWDGAVARSRERLAAILEEGGLDQPAHLEWPGQGHLSVRRVVFDLVEEYGRHTGHADLLREAVDGRVGEDPPAGWRPVSGSGA
ncbi:DUF664 domain-containing protein [Glycomyces sp. NPDC049804]|uniref:mycothiol transferase n=1 Tax=Glycomyces sp. NPDC049804 TaxID=3154363 RepID=UPI003443860D